MEDGTLACVRASVHWYDAVFRTHGLAGVVRDGLWTCRGAPLPYHSNAIALSPAGADAQTDAIRSLLTALPHRFTVKDSFRALDLAPLGFGPLFDATWLRLDPADVRSASDAGVRWRRVISPTDLQVWETAWRRGSPCDSPVFAPPVLADDSIALFGAACDGRVAAVCAGNRAPDAVGFSNFLVLDGDPDALAASAVNAVSRWAPGLPVVGYASGAELEPLLGMGFRAAGPLRVWRSGALAVRPYEDADLEEVAALWHRSKRDAYPFLPAEQARTLDEDRAFLRERIVPRCRLWVGLDGGAVAGFLAMEGSTIDRLYVDPSRQRRGVGRALMDEAFRQAPEELRLFTHVANGRARRFYERLGFEAVAFGRSPPPESAPDVEYRWRPRRS